MKKLHLKFGSIEIDLETPDLKADLAVVLSAIQQYSTVAGADTPSPPLLGENPGSPKQHTRSEQHMNSFVAKLGANTGRKIIHAAALHLSLNDGRESFSRDELFARAREARDWKSDYVNQQSTSVARMVKSGELIEKSAGVYGLPSKELESAVQALNS